MTQQQISVMREHPIETLALPAGWHETMSGTGDRPGSIERIFKNANFPSAKIFLYQSGFPASSAVLDRLHSLLSERAQILTRTKIENVIEVMGNMGRPTVFRPLMIRTEAISGKNVLSVEGSWSDNEEAYALFMPTNGRILELHYQAPRADFRKNLAAIKASFSTIVWQST
ncbi:MAG TPA: hypothetical protein V6C76_01725 [Drouetiella sp.]